jgi:maleylpyruvate isomerase
MRQGTELIISGAAYLPDAAFGEPSALPGWTRAHVLGHLARNAEALARLVRWAATGEVTPMYPDAASRAAGIEASARQSPARLRNDLTDTATALDAALVALDEPAWRSRVRSALGRELPALEIPWMRIREVWLHAIDLGVGLGFAVVPPDLVDLLLDDATAVVGAKPDCPPLRLHPTDRAADRTWTLGGADAPRTVVAAAADLLAWVTGRTPESPPHAADGLPALPPWL